MRHGGYIYYASDFQASCLKRSYGSFSAGSYTFYSYIYSADSMLLGASCYCICRNLCSKRSAFSGTFKTMSAGTAPCNGVTVQVGYIHNCIIKGRLNMSNPVRYVFSFFAFYFPFTTGFFCQIYLLKLLLKPGFFY